MNFSQCKLHNKLHTYKLRSFYLHQIAYLTVQTMHATNPLRAVCREKLVITVLMHATSVNLIFEVYKSPARRQPYIRFTDN